MIIVRNKTWIVTVVLLLVALLGLAVDGCGSTTTTADPATTTTGAAKVKAGMMFSITNPPKAGGWDRADWVGVQYLKNDLGWEIAVAEGVPYPQTAGTAPGYAEKGYNLSLIHISEPTR